MSGLEWLVAYPGEESLFVQPARYLEGWAYGRRSKKKKQTGFWCIPWILWIREMQGCMTYTVKMIILRRWLNTCSMCQVSRCFLIGFGAWGMLSCYQHVLHIVKKIQTSKCTSKQNKVLMQFFQVSIQENLFQFTSCIWTATHDIKCHTFPYSHIWNLPCWRMPRIQMIADQKIHCQNRTLQITLFSLFHFVMIRFPKADYYIFSWCKKQKAKALEIQWGNFPMFWNFPTRREIADSISHSQ